MAEGKEVQQFDGRWYVMERALRADFSLVKALRGDTLGNLQYAFTAMNFNPAMATASRHTIAEVEEVVAVGEMQPAQIHTPGVYVKCLLLGKNYEKRIEQRTVALRPA